MITPGLKSQERSVEDIFDVLDMNSWYLPSDDSKAKLYVTSIGHGDTVVSLHGGPGNNFYYLVDAFRNNTHSNCFLLYDQRGSLLSRVPDSIANTLNLMVLVEDLEQLRIETGQNKLTLFGHSFGSMVVLFYYIKYPGNVKKLILTGAMPPYLSKGSSFGDFIKVIHSRLRSLRERPEVEAVLRDEGLWEEVKLSAQELSNRYKITGLASFNMMDLRNWRKFKGGRAFFNPMTESAIGSSIPDYYDIRNTLKDFPVPIHIIQGKEDYVPVDSWLELSRIFENVKVHLVENSSHYIWLDKPKEFSELLDNSLK